MNEEERQETKSKLQRAMIIRLCNTAKGTAQSVLLDKNMPEEKRKIEFEVIEEFVDYVRDYHANVEIIKEQEDKDIDER